MLRKINFISLLLESYLQYSFWKKYLIAIGTEWIKVLGGNYDLFRPCLNPPFMYTDLR